MIDTLRARLAVLCPEHLDLRDDSHQHAGHAGARQGGHFTLFIVSPRFAGLSALQRHRLVYDAIGDLEQHGIHALSIIAKTPDETSLSPSRTP